MKFAERGILRASRSALLASALLLFVLLASFWVTGRKAPPVELVPTLTGQPEYCLTCHADLPEISPSHPVQIFGCVICHGGERLALDADLAHSTMRGGRNPSDLAVVEASCGGSNCHSGDPIEGRNHIQRVMSSIQGTYAGAISSVRYAFGAQPDQIAQVGIYSVQDLSGNAKVEVPQLFAFDPAHETSPAVLAFAQNCLSCHLTAEPLYKTGSQTSLEFARMTGCAACHTPTAGAGYTGDPQEFPPVHRLTTAIAYTQCNTCHNRGSYDLREMQFNPRQDQPADRLHDYYQPIAQFTRCEYELDCIDCHTRQETMGDGHLYSRQDEAQYIQCRTCHGTLDAPPRTRTLRNPNDIALRQAFLNPAIDLKIGDTILITEKDEPMWNIRQTADGSFEMVAKATGTRYAVPLVMGSACEQKPDEQESRYCYACHAVER